MPIEFVLNGTTCRVETRPGARWYGLFHNDWPGFVAEGEEVRCVGDVLAAVTEGT